MNESQQPTDNYRTAEIRLESLGYSPATRKMLLDWATVLGDGFCTELLEMDQYSIAGLVNELRSMGPLGVAPNA